MTQSQNILQKSLSNITFLSLCTTVSVKTSQSVFSYQTYKCHQTSPEDVCCQAGRCALLAEVHGELPATKPHHLVCYFFHSHFSTVFESQHSWGVYSLFGNRSTNIKKETLKAYDFCSCFQKLPKKKKKANHRLQPSATPYVLKSYQKADAKRLFINKCKKNHFQTKPTGLGLGRRLRGAEFPRTPP